MGWLAMKNGVACGLGDCMCKDPGYQSYHKRQCNRSDRTTLKVVGLNGYNDVSALPRNHKTHKANTIRNFRGEDREVPNE